MRFMNTNARLSRGNNKKTIEYILEEIYPSG
jgi:hypothetical protein